MGKTLGLQSYACVRPQGSLPTRMTMLDVLAQVNFIMSAESLGHGCSADFCSSANCSSMDSVLVIAQFCLSHGPAEHTKHLSWNDVQCIC